MSPVHDDLAASTDKLSLATPSSTRGPRGPAKKPNPNASTALRDLTRQHVDHQKLLRVASTRPLIAGFFAPSMFSQQPLSALKPMRLSEYHPDNDGWEGRYIMCRSLGGPVKTDELIFAAEDQDGRILFLYLHKYPLYDKNDGDPLDPASLAVLFPPGTGFAVREPLVAQATSRAESIRNAVHVLTPTDVEVYRPDAATLSEVEWATASPFRPSSTSCAELRALADKARTKRACAVAVKRMTDALALAETPADMAAAALHHALVCLDTGQFGLAYRDTSFVDTYVGMGVELSTVDQLHLHTRRCRALVGLGLIDRAERELDRFDEACPVPNLSRMDDDALDEFQEQTLSGKNKGAAFGRDLTETALGIGIVSMRRSITRALRESEVGVDAASGWVRYEEAAESAPFGDLAIGHYVGPIRVAQLKKRRGGRGVIATRDIEPGELLLVERAFALSRGYTTRTSRSYEDNKNPPPPAHRELIEEVVARVLDDPSTLSILEALYDGERPPAKPLVFGSMQDRYVSEFSSASIDLDPVWVERICSINGLTLFRDLHGTADELDSWSALFIDGSAFNHSCVANTYHKTLGDVLVVRARVPIKKGKEVYLSYAPLATLRGEGRALYLSRHFDAAGCPCAHCVEHGWDLDGNVEDREKILRRCLTIICEMDRINTASPAAMSKRWDDLILLTTALKASYAEECTQALPILGVACATLLDAAETYPSPLVGDEERIEWLDVLVRASGSSIDKSAPAWRLVPPPLCSPRTVVRNSLVCARASFVTGGDDGRARALGYLSLAARQCRIEHGDDLAGFWARWDDLLEELEPLREPLAELLGETERA